MIRVVFFQNCVVHEVSLTFGANREIGDDEILEALETAFKDAEIEVDITYYDVRDDRGEEQPEEDEED